MRTDEHTRALIERVAKALGAGRRARVLAEIAWPRATEERFFAQGARELPQVSYAVDRDALNARVTELGALEASIDGDDAVAAWLRATVRSYVDANRLLLATGTRDFYAISRELYGAARTPFFGGPRTNLDLARHLTARLESCGWDEAQDPDVAPLDDAAFARALRARAAARTPRLDVEVALDDGIAAKVLAGTTRVRVRRGATFMPWEVDNLWSHEVETHALTAQNGAAQPHATFLQGGGPRTTRTQEGLAIFAELYDRNLSAARMRRLATRVVLVDMAERGADFLELYRFLREQGSAERDAYLDAQRVCRGASVAGGAPFTKDACYLGGLLEVYAFLSAVIREGARDEAECLVCGRIALDDMPALVELRQRGLVARPAYLPPWLAHWRSLLPYFAFASFMGDVDLAPVEAHFARVVELAEAHVAPRRKRRRAAPRDDGGGAD